MKYHIIKPLLEEKKISIKKIAKDIGVSEQGFHKFIREQNMKVKVLEKLAKELELPISHFFDEDKEIEKISIKGNYNIGNGNKLTVNEEREKYKNRYAMSSRTFGLIY